MGEHTGIAWCDHTFNIAWGCQKVSPGCQHCYADTAARRYGLKIWGPPATTSRRTFGEKHWNEPLKWDRAAKAAGVRRRVFCSSMADVFEKHPTVQEQLVRLWPLIRATSNLDWLLLTKRPDGIMESLPDDWGTGYANVWLGTSVESQDYVSRARALSAVPAVLRFLSCEPLIGPLDLTPILGAGKINWVIAGGESGGRARPCDLAWLRSLRLQCDRACVPFFLKQLGGVSNKRDGEQAVLDGQTHVEWPEVAHA